MSFKVIILISISVVSHGQSKLVLALLADLKRLAPRQIAQIIIVHNDSDDSTAFPSKIGDVPVVQLVNSTRRGFGANHNAAFRLATQPFFAVLNPDLRLPSNPFLQLLKFFDDNKLGLVAPSIVNSNLTPASSARHLYSPSEIFRGAIGLEKPALDPAWLAGMFLLFRQEAFARVNGFDERYFMYVEDVDICARIRLAGWKLHYDRQSMVIHEAQRANRRSVKHLVWHLKSALRWWFTPVFWQYRHFLLSNLRR
jgi:N-acetylglucosaminyl-diphospho-decaprenol L-rhamnosyltransferase